MNYGLLRGRKEPRWRRSSWVEKELGCDLANQKPQTEGKRKAAQDISKALCNLDWGVWKKPWRQRKVFLPSFRVFLDINCLLEWKA